MLIFLLFGQGCGAGLLAGEATRIIVKEEAAVVSDSVILKDIADLRGPDGRLLDKLGQTKMIDSPVFGETAILNHSQIAQLIRAFAGPLPAGTLVGAPAVRIRLQGRQITAAEICPMLRASILEATSWKESEIEIGSIGNLNGIELPPSNADFRVSASGPVFGTRNMLVPLEILQDGKNLRSYWITAGISIRAEVLTAVRKISSGRTITADDIVKKSIEIPDIRASYFRSPEDVVGKISRRALLPGALLTRETIGDPFLVKSGETVRLRLQRDGIMLTSLVKAEQDGRLGQYIKVRSIDFSTCVKAQVTGRSEVRMQ